MNIFKTEPTFKFLNKRYYAFGLSALIILAGVATYFVRGGFNMGIDFSGGTMVEVGFNRHVEISDLRMALVPTGMGDAQITRIGGEQKFFIKTMNVSDQAMKSETMDDHEVVARKIENALMSPEEKAQTAAGKIDLNNTAIGELSSFLRGKGLPDADCQEAAQQIIDARKTGTGIIRDFASLEARGLKHKVMAVLRDSAFLGKYTMLSVEIVGPQVGRDLQKKATMACIGALIGMLLYIAFRFQFLYGLAGILTLAHDVLIALSFILFFNVEMSLQTIAAILTIVGYSINDTIVIFDRLRDNMKTMKKDNLEAILDKTLNQTLSRTIFTSFTVLLTVLSLFLFAGEVIRPFAFTMLVGVISGSYSTIYQSCGWLQVWEKSFLKRKKR